MTEAVAGFEGAHGPKPRRTFSRRNIFLYGTLIMVALYYHAAALRDDRHVAERHAGDPAREHLLTSPVEITFQPWVKAWAEACTGLNCDGLSRGFFNSVRILGSLGSAVSIAIASVNGYALANWRFKGSETCSSPS